MVRVYSIFLCSPAGVQCCGGSAGTAELCRSWEMVEAEFLFCWDFPSQQGMVVPQPEKLQIHHWFSLAEINSCLLYWVYAQWGWAAHNWLAYSEIFAFQYSFGGFISEKESFKTELEIKPSSTDEQLFYLKSCWIFSLLLAALSYLFQQCMGLFVLMRWTDFWGLSPVYLVQLSAEDLFFILRILFLFYLFYPCAVG